MLLLTLRDTYALNRLSSFKNLRRKAGKFDHRPGRPKVLLRHWRHVTTQVWPDTNSSCSTPSSTSWCHSDHFLMAILVWSV